MISKVPNNISYTIKEKAIGRVLSTKKGMSKTLGLKYS
ncbi:hypothetical protein JBKA6_0419 [Ichthyobacterium seriolicida]|uniref:Uncharacterized protein n=1 Tax=Ichthyobacterium seriolicida TaxID=242600 RepID=A0A1J1EA86_9FLAO|nr:hypothetical protein JBKA6_0419 [Ichthyobacterium seriolicida]